MNQTLKETVYGKGTKRQAEFMAELGGMNEEEKEMFFMMHEGKTDQVIMDYMNLSKRSYKRVEESVRAKLLLAIFDCINYRMNEEPL